MVKCSNKKIYMEFIKLSVNVEDIIDFLEM